jgi:hypothetical protein
MKARSIFLILLVFQGVLKAQVPTWSDRVAEIIYTNCTGCHNPNGIAPFSLTNFEEAKAHSASIYSAVFSGEMPPWPPDTTYQQYAYSRVLDKADVEAIRLWATGGTPLGDEANEPCPPVQSLGGQILQPDLSLRIPEYRSKATATQDNYVCFSLPVSGLNQTRYIKSVEVIPGNPAIVHHVLVYVDTFGSFQTDTSGLCMGADGSGALVYGYAPGSLPMVFPNGAVNMGVGVPPGSNIVLAMHYPE